MPESTDSGQQQEKNIIVLDNFVSTLAQLKLNIDVYFNELQRFNEEDNEKFGFIEKFKRLFNFKLDNLIEWFLDLEDEVLGSSTDAYYQILFNSDQKITNSSEQVTRLVDAFLTQYFSLFDIFVKFVCNFKFPKLADEIDSLGTLYYYLDKHKDDVELKTVFGDMVANRTFFENMKNYRDYLVHQGNLSIEPTRQNPDEQGYSLNSFYMFEINKIEPRKYSKSKMNLQKVNIFIRQGLGFQVQSFSNTLDRMRLEYYKPEEKKNKKAVLSAGLCLCNTEFVH